MRQCLSSASGLLVAGAVVALTLTGCKDSDKGTVKVQPQSHASSDGTSLNIEVRNTSAVKTKSYTLTCSPTGGNLPQAGKACAVLANAKGDPFAPTPKDQMCTQIYGGPEVAKVTGTWNGKQVDSQFSRKNGCELKRWATLGDLFGPVPPVR